MPWRLAHCPVKIDARLMLQIGDVTYEFLNSTPCCASASSVGVWITLLPAASKRMSSASRNRMLGGASTPSIRGGGGRRSGLTGASGEFGAPHEATLSPVATTATMERRSSARRRTSNSIATYD